MCLGPLSVPLRYAKIKRLLTLFLASLPPSPTTPSQPPPPNYREISTLASWTVSSSKPGCSIPQLRHPSHSLFWQSDGPQPHTLNIHFFKLVRIVGLRLYLDFEADESYTPTRIVLLAGSGGNDLVEWGEMRLESPRGWVWADFEGVGDPESDSEDDSGDEDGDDEGAVAGDTGRANAGLGIRDVLEHDGSDSENAAPVPPRTTAPTDPSPNPAPDPMHLEMQGTPTAPTLQGNPNLPRPHPRTPFTPLTSNASPQQPATRSKKPKTPVLRCHLVQIKILENHQNGKDTHLRGLQIFAKDKEKGGRAKRKTMATVEPKTGGEMIVGAGKGVSGKGLGMERKPVRGLTQSDWMAEPSIR